MIEWFTLVQVWVAVAAGLFCVAMGLAGRKPNDFTMGSVVVVEVLLIAQIVISAVALALGYSATGDVLEYWVYLITAVLIPPLCIFWGLVDRSKWSTVILGVGAFAVAVMVYRMGEIWFVQVA
ncbi:MAG: hypothetical protein ACOH1J_01130 [Microbacteriaceae bacterium]